MKKRIICVFPRRTAATPDDELVRIAEPPSLFDEADEADELHELLRTLRIVNFLDI